MEKVQKTILSPILKLIQRARAKIERTLEQLFCKLAEKMRGFVLNGLLYGPPSKVFSLLHQDLLTKRTEFGRIAFLGQGTQIAHKPSIIELSGLDTNSVPKWPFFWAYIKNAHLRGRGLSLFDQANSVCQESIGSPNYKIAKAWFDVSLGGPISLKGPITSIISQWVPYQGPTNYAHWLFEALPRLALVEEMPPSTKILVPSKLPDFARQSLHDLGYSDRLVSVNKSNLCLENFYFTSTPAHIVCYNPFAVRWLREKWLKPIESKKAGRRLYLHRPRPYRTNANEEEVCKYFETQGWNVVDCSKISFHEQIALFSGAKMVAGPHGAAFANIVWCQQGTKVLEIFSSAFLNGCYEWVARELSLDYRFMVCPRNFHGEAKVDLRQLEKLLVSLQNNADFPAEYGNPYKAGRH